MAHFHLPWVGLSTGVWHQKCLCEDEAPGSGVRVCGGGSTKGGRGIRPSQHDRGKLGLVLSEPQIPQLENGLGEQPAPRAVLKVR